MKLPVLTTPVQSRYSDTNHQGHIDHEVFVTYMAIGRMAYFAELGRLTGSDIDSVVVNIKMDFLREIRYGDDMAVVTWCHGTGNTSITLGTRILKNGEIAAAGHSVNVLRHPRTGKPRAVPENWQASDAGVVGGG